MTTRAAAPYRARPEVDAEAEFRDALAGRNITPPENLVADGRLHRCDAVGRNGRGDAAYVLHLDAFPAGGFENWRDGRGWQNWKADLGRHPTRAECEEIRVKAVAARIEREADGAHREAAAAEQAAAILFESQACIHHPYLSQKGIQAHGLRVLRGKLVVPLRNIDGALHSLQFIGEDGSKKFLFGGPVRGCFFTIGDLVHCCVIVIGEGFATMATIREATGWAVVIAFNAGNLKAVAEAIRARYPNALIVIAADDDHLTSGNPGLAKAKEAVASVDGMVAIPQFGADRPDKATDWNDLNALAGSEEVRRQFAAMLAEGHAKAAAALQSNASPKNGEAKGPSQRDKLLSVSDRGTFWRCPDGIAYATIPVAGHLEHHRVRSQQFRDWLIVTAGREFPTEVAGKVRPSTFGKTSIEDALTACEANAAASEKVVPASLRVARAERVLYLDLGTPDWNAVEIAADCWRVIPRAPVPILRTRRTRSLPIPTSGGSLAPLRELLPIGEDDDWRLVILWLLAALRPTGPYPILALSGEQGTGKSFTARVLRRLVDPCGDDIMQPPREDGDLIADARGNHVLAFDNLSTVSPELADSLCRLATGGDIGGRALYTNDESAAFAAQRPIIINGIPDLVSRGDLVSRAIFVRLKPMKRRRTEAELRAYFDKVAPGVLGALLDVLAAASAQLPKVRLPDDNAAFRMADFALLAVASESALDWPSGAALASLRRNMRGAAALMTDLDPVAIAIRALLDRDGQFEGLVSTLHTRLTEITDMEIRRAPGWPKNASRLGEHLRRLAPALRGAGIDMVERRGSMGMIVQIRVRSPGVGNGSPLFESLQEEVNSVSMGPEHGAVISGPVSPTLPTPLTKNAGNLGGLDGSSGVGGVGGRTSDPSGFTRPGTKRRVVL